MKKSQNGFVLISVLLITTIATLYAFNEIQGNKLQEQIGGNQQKEMNARFLAEKGILLAHEHLIEQISLGKINSAISASVGSYVTNNTLDVEGNVSVIVTDISPLGDFTLISSASYYNANAYMKAIIKRMTPEAEKVWGAGVIACEGVTINGSGKVDSYNSKLAVYDALSSTGQGDIKTVSENADIEISGGALIDGDVAATGEININSGSVNGDINANKDVYLANVAGVNDVGAGGDFRFDNGSALSGSANIVNDVEFSGDITPQVVGEGLNYGGTSNHSLIAGGGVGNAPIRETVASSDCDPFDITTQITSMRTDMVDRGITNLAGEGASANHVITTMTTGHTEGIDPLSFTATSAQVFDLDSGNTTKTITPQIISSFIDAPEGFDVGDKAVYIFDDLNLVNQGIEIDGDVTIYVKGDLTTSGGGSGFTIASGATGTLTIISEGTVNIGSDSQVFPSVMTAVGEDVTPPIRIYSSLESETSEIAALKNTYKEKQAASEELKIPVREKNKAYQEAVAAKQQGVVDGLSYAELEPFRDNINAARVEHEVAKANLASAVNIENIAKSAFKDAKASAIDAFIYNGDTEMYGAVYAPKGYVDITASGDLMGSVRGKEIMISGDGGIHYDAALLEYEDGGDPPLPEYTLFSSMFYYYP